jgi:hypothetical protein
MEPQPQDLSEAQLQERAREAGLLARTPAEWFEIYQEITEHGVRTILEKAGDGHRVIELLSPWRADAKVVKREFQAHGVPLDEEIEAEGPVPISPVEVHWPRGLWVTFHWPDRSHLTFRGNKAIIAWGFIDWWTGFQMQFQAMQDPNSPKEQARQAKAPKTRLIEPGSPQWNAYFAAKEAAKKRGEDT